MTEVSDISYRPLIRRLTEGRESLGRNEMAAVVSGMLECRYSDIETASVLVALATKGESPEEIAGAVDAILERSVPLPAATSDAIDIGGTGDDRAGTFNISTVAAIIVAAAGAKVIKHGNRRVTSACGSADLISALGADLDRCSQPEYVPHFLERCHFSFVSTSVYLHFPHTINRIRQTVGIRTVFNLAGPLVHPARVSRQIVGVARHALVSGAAEQLLCDFLAGEREI